MAVFPEEQSGLGRRDAARRKPADLLARSGLPVPELKAQEDVEGFNADFRRLVARIAKMFATLAPTLQGQTEDAQNFTLAPHVSQHADGGSDELNVGGLSGVLLEDQPAQAHALDGTKHTAAGLTIGQVLRATGPTTFTFQSIQDSDLPSSITRDTELTPYGARTIGLTLDGAGVSTGQKGFVRVPFAGTIQRWTLMADVSGSIVLDIWKDSFGNFPPVVGDSIIGAGDEPTLSSQQAADAAPSGWTTVAVAAGDVLAFNVESVGGLGRVTLMLDVQI